MRYWLFIIVMVFINPCISNGMDNDVWTAFRDKSTGLIGYRDSNGIVKIPPKFIFADAKKFKNIIVVGEQINRTTSESYYLLKNGKKIGVGSIYIWDNTPDCESEEKIRFRDKTTEKVGFFDKNGKIIIPAVYNEALPFRNNMAVGLKNAQRVCWSGKKYSEQNKCEHWSWKGGKTFLINDKNEILIKNFNYNRNLDWFSLKIMDDKKEELNREVFKGTNGKYYSFINFETEFKNWFKSTFLLSINSDALKKNCASEIAFWSNAESDWITKQADKFLAENKDCMIRQINDFRMGNMEYTVHKEPLNPYIFNNEKYAIYFDSCGNAREWQNPVFTVLSSHENDKGILELDFKTYFQFLRTRKGYKMISLGTKNKEFKH